MRSVSFQPVALVFDMLYGMACASRSRSQRVAPFRAAAASSFFQSAFISQQRARPLRMRAVFCRIDVIFAFPQPRRRMIDFSACLLLSRYRQPQMVRNGTFSRSRENRRYRHTRGRAPVMHDNLNIEVTSNGDEQIISIS
jgi:hypothetical protein